jgi:hypothetical protein
VRGQQDQRRQDDERQRRPKRIAAQWAWGSSGFLHRVARLRVQIIHERSDLFLLLRCVTLFGVGDCLIFAAKQRLAIVFPPPASPDAGRVVAQEASIRRSERRGTRVIAPAFRSHHRSPICASPLFFYRDRGRAVLACVPVSLETAWSWPLVVQRPGLALQSSTTSDRPNISVCPALLAQPDIASTH